MYDEIKRFLIKNLSHAIFPFKCTFIITVLLHVQLRSKEVIMRDYLKIL